jgi:hypothetical protein
MPISPCFGIRVAIIDRVGAGMRQTAKNRTAPLQIMKDLDKMNAAHEADRSFAASVEWA